MIKTLPHLDAVYCLIARYYMWLVEYTNAKDYARKAINTSKKSPMTEEQWLSTTRGFIAISCWMWGSQMQSEDEAVQTGILNWASIMSQEALYGYAWSNGGGIMSKIDAKLYARIKDTDFRKKAWKAPAGSALEGQTPYIDPSIDDYLPAYTGVKFRPGNGNMNDYTVGSASAYPFMRGEEMYLIVAEAAAHLNAGEGKSLLE